MTIAVEIPTDRDPCWWEEAIITTRLRFAAGICVVSTGLLIGSSAGAIAWADTEATGSNAAQSQSAEGPSADVGSASAPTKKIANPLRTTLHATIQGLTSTLRSIRTLRQPHSLSQQHSTNGGPVTTVSAATNTGSDSEGSDSTAADPSPTAPDVNEAVSDQTVTASDQTVVASESTAVPPATNPPVPPVVEPVANAVATVVNAFGSVPAALMALPTSPTPVTDVITKIQEMLTAVTNVVVAFTQLSSDLYSLLAVPAATATTTVGGGVNPANAPVLAARASQSLEASPIFLAGGMALPADIAPLVTLGPIATTGLSNSLPASGIASLTEDAIVQSGLGSFLEHAVKALFVPASLSALAAVALPGVGGLLIICAFGVRIGYRQAKALFEVRRAGIASFAGPGPLGVVRSGSLIALRSPRAARVVRSNASLAAGRLDQAA